jgi:hypothetical protein
MRLDDVAGDNICASSSPYLTHVVLVKVAHRCAGAYTRSRFRST